MDTVLWRVFSNEVHTFFLTCFCGGVVGNVNGKWSETEFENETGSQILFEKNTKIHAAPVNMSSADNLPAVLTFCIVRLRFEALGLFQVLQPIKPAALQNSISSTSLTDYQIYKNKHALGAVSATRLSMLPMQA